MERLWEVDSARGLALVLMLVFNWSETLEIFGIYTVSDGWLYQYLFPRFIASMFLFIAGVSLTLSINRFKEKNPDSWREKAPLKYLKRGLYIFSLGLAITAVTYIFFPERFIFFGILHLIGVSIALSHPVIDRPKIAGGIGAAIIALSPLISGIEFLGRLGASIGFSTKGIAALDLFPVIPWTGVVLLGISTGYYLFPGGIRRYNVPESFFLKLPEFTRRCMSIIGRNTLMIYLLHQPFLVLILVLAGFPVI
ncbi:MAG: heparan-alpha-glucosaminide N-acetyltransferase [Candidatus Nanohaloarchaea archaeon]|nr:heparan-alpha-glucosaminide N-acetyltransferase [Candidatus Nanohaloarchaea archaeon]